MQHEKATNLDLWEGWADLHAGGAYDVEGFVADPDSRPFDSVIREALPDVRGKHVLHMQCHIGLDTIRLARLGADSVTGVDFSPKAVAAAREIAERMGARIEFVQAEVDPIPDGIAEGPFDVIFTSYGTIMWLPDLEPWAESIASRLAPGGRFLIVDLHPFASVFDDEVAEPELRVRYSYFTREPQYFQEQGTYVDRDADFVADSYFWQHTFEEIVGVLARRGLVIESLREYPAMAWTGFDFLERDPDEDLWRMPASAGDVPLMFSLLASKPAEGHAGL